MGKKSHKRSSTPAKVNAACMWGFIRKFEFSQSYNLHKLLSDIKRRSARYHGTSFLGNNHPEDSFESKYGLDANDVDGLGASLPSVKLLIEEEMSKEKVSKTLGSILKSTCKMTKNQNIHSDPRIENLMVSAQVSFEQYKSRDPLEGSNLTFDLAALMVEFYCISHHFRDIHAELEADLCTPLNTSGQKKHSNLEQSDSQFAHRHSMLQEALGVEAESFLCQKIDDVKRQVGNGSIQSQEFMDALEILNSNKELFLNLFQDPNSLIFKHIQGFLKPQIAEFSRLETHHCLEVREQLEEYIGNSDKSEKSNSNHMFPKQKQHYFSKEKDGFRGKNASKFRNTSKEMSRIVVLKPHEPKNEGDSASKSPCFSPEPHYTHKLEKGGESVSSHFSFREIKRRLRHIIGERRKEQHLISRDGLLHKIPSGFKVPYDTDRINSTQNSRTHVASQTNCSAESTCQPYPCVSKTDKKVKAKQCQQKVESETTQGKRQGIASVSLLHRESYYEEAKKHLSEILSTEYKSNILKTSQVSKSLEKMLYKPDYNLLSPRFSPHSVKEKKFSPQLTLSSPKLQLIDDTPANLSLLEESLKGTPCTSSDLDVEKLVDLEAENDKVNLQEETCNGELNTKVSVEVVETENVKSLDINPLEECDSLIIPAASVGSEHGSCESCIEEGCTQSEQGTPNERSKILIPSASISPSSLIITDFRTSVSIFEKPDRPSPVSVLEPFFLEDDASPDCASIESTQLRMSLAPMYLENYDDSEVFITTSDSPIACQRTYSYDIEAIITFARTLLENYGLNSEMIPERWPSSNQLLQPSLLEEIQACHSSCIEDSKLVLDCVNEVLMEIKDRQCQFSPWVSFLKPSVRLILEENNIIQEVCKTIEKYPSSQLNSTLNEIMRKDMDSARWMDHRLEMECIIAETSHSIFEELVEETILEIFL